MIGWLDVPRGWLDAFGEIARFGSRVAGLVYSGRVLRYFGESLRQAGILILGSALVIWAFVFILGLQCGVIGAYFNRSIGAPSLAGLFSAYCDLREGLPYAFGYILSAKVGTGIVAELGAMRISDEIDALEVMGIQPVTFLAATRLLGAWIAIPFLYLVGVGVAYFASYLAVVDQVGDVSSGGYLLVFWTYQDFVDVLFSLAKGMVMTTVIVLVGCYYGYTASGGPVGVGTATAKSMVVNIIMVHMIGMLGTFMFYGANPRPDRRLSFRCALCLSEGQKAHRNAIHAATGAFAGLRCRRNISRTHSTPRRDSSGARNSSKPFAERESGSSGPSAGDASG